jgi:hypothetical protein
MLRSKLIAVTRRGLGCILLATFSCAQALAQHVPTDYIRVPNDGVNSDRFKDPEAAARASIDRFNTLFSGGEYLTFDRVEYWSTPTIQAWSIYYYHHSPNNVGGPYLYGSSAIRYFVCDATPKIGLNYRASHQGLPKLETYNPSTYANGCPEPQVDIVCREPPIAQWDDGVIT